MTRRWLPRHAGPEPALCDDLAGSCGLPPLLAILLGHRGLTSREELEVFLDPRLADLPDPFGMSGMAAAVVRLADALVAGEAIVVHGDYDVDGITATALLVDVLASCGARVDYHIPLRLADGYGLSARALRESARAGARLVISVDCGISAHAEALLAADLGLDLIITDHHQPPPDLPKALALINPHQPGCSFPDKDLSGVGVAFFLMAGLRRELRRRNWFTGGSGPDLREVLDLVALGTIADLVPLRGVNRTLVKAGLERLQRLPRPGVRALREVAAVREVSAGAVGFRLAPRLNAAGRLEDAALGVELLLSRKLPPALEMARQLDLCNSERQALERQTLDEAIARVEGMDELSTRHALVLADPHWHPGVVGIVASRLVERYHRPVVLLSLDAGVGRGSARSIRGFHLYRGLAACAGHLEGFGGHEFAAGLSVREERIPGFGAAFESEARRQLLAEDLVPVRFYDLEAGLEEIDRELIKALGRLAPFGIGNPEPVLLLRNARVQQVVPVGDQHLRFICRQGGESLPAIAFGMAGRREELGGELDLLVVPVLNRWQERESLQLQIRDIRPAERTGEDEVKVNRA